MKKVLFASLFMFIFIAGSLSDYIDYDFFARMIVGKTFFQTGDILKYDFLSYGPTHPWYDHEWGASVIFYFIQNHFGDLGLLFLKTLTIFIAFVFLVKIIDLRRKVLNPDIKFPIYNFLFFYIMLVALKGNIYSLRCHHFTFLFFAIWLYVLEKARLEKNYKILWVLPPLMTVWSNIHGGCFMAIGITGIYLIGEFLKKRSFMPYLYTIIFSFLFMLINPYGIDYVIFLIKATTMNRPYISEWFSPFSGYYKKSAMLYKLILFSTLGFSIYNFKKKFASLNQNSDIEKVKTIIKELDFTKTLLIFVMIVLTVKSLRFIPYFIFILIPFCYDDYYKFLTKRLPDKWNRLKEIGICTVLYVALLANFSVRDFKNANYHTIFPLSEVEFLEKNNIKGNLLVPFEVGSYAAYKLYPNNFIFMDGRYEEAYPIDLNDKYLHGLVMGHEGWEKALENYRHDIILIYKDYNVLYNNLLKHPDYIETIASRKFSLFLRKDVWERAKKPFIVPTSDEEYYKNTLWDTHINWEK